MYSLKDVYIKRVSSSARNEILLGILETSFNGLKTRNERNIRRSTSMFASANIVMALFSIVKRIVQVLGLQLYEYLSKYWYSHGRKRATPFEIVYVYIWILFCFCSNKP